MEFRIEFKSRKFRNLFFRKVLLSNRFKHWKECQNKFGISKTTLERYRNGELTLPSTIYENLIRNLEDKEFFNKKIMKKDSNWGRIKGGINSYKKNKKLFDSGRIKGLKKMNRYNPKFDIYMPLSKELCEIIGLIIGDGFTNKYGSHYLTQFTGHTNEENYYKKIIIPYMESLFNLKHHFKKEKECNAVRISYYSKTLFHMLTERFKLKKGRNSYSVIIPKEIINSKDEFLLATVRGIFDAEGSVYFDKRKIYKKPYPILEVHLNNSHLIQQLNQIIKRKNIKTYVRDNNSRLYILGHKEVKKFVRLIGFSNNKHIRKLSPLSLNKVL
ncbi:MAG: hypothetical protein KKG75_02655 [Nanoarchaeota archaeon]|nr:hypothetical protein [Nanoarchaeota archaeon]